MATKILKKSTCHLLPPEDPVLQEQAYLKAVSEFGENGIYSSEPQGAPNVWGEVPIDYAYPPYIRRTKPVLTFREFPAKGLNELVYINFDGYTVANTAWNGDGGTIVAAPSPMSAADRLIAFNQVAHVYRAWMVEFTMDRAVYDAYTGKKMMVIVTPTNTWAAPGYSGLAYVGSMYWSEWTPCFVFSNVLYENAAFVGAIIIHELGHTIGLNHICTYTLQGVFQNSYAHGCWMGNPFNGGSFVDGPTSCGSNLICKQYDHQVLTYSLGLKWPRPA